MLRRWTWIGAVALLSVVWLADWVAGATVPELFVASESGYDRVETPFTPAFATTSWWLVEAPRLGVTVLVLAAIAAARRRRRAAHVCALTATALLCVVLIHVAADEALALRAGVFAAEAAVAIAVAAALTALRQ